MQEKAEDGNYSYQSAKSGMHIEVSWNSFSLHRLYNYLIFLLISFRPLWNEVVTGSSGCFFKKIIKKGKEAKHWEKEKVSSTLDKGSIPPLISCRWLHQFWSLLIYWDYNSQNCQLYSPTWQHFHFPQQKTKTKTQQHHLFCNVGMVFKYLEIPFLRKGAITKLSWVFNRITELSDGMIDVKTTFKVEISIFQEDYFFKQLSIPYSTHRRLSEKISAIES